MRLVLDRVQPTARGLVVAGTLVDEATNEPMLAERVILNVGRLEPDGSDTSFFADAAYVDEDGGFRFVLRDLARQRYVLRLGAEGTASIAGPRPVERVVDLARRTSELRLSAPAEHPASSPTLPITLELY